MDSASYPHRSSHLSPDSSIRGGPDDDDTLIDYGDDDSSKFGEDGSFIGQYVTRKRADRERDRLERERLEREAHAMVSSQPHHPGAATFV
jgi:hypothetical protein